VREAVESNDEDGHQVEANLEDAASILLGDSPMTFRDMNVTQTPEPLSLFEESASMIDDQSRQMNIEQWQTRFSNTLPELDQLDTPPPPASGMSSFDFDHRTERRPSRDDSQAGRTGEGTLINENIQSLYGSSPTSTFLRQSPTRAAAPSDRLSILPPLQRSLEDPSSTLVEYYFKEVAGLFSSYDSHMNPFRTTVSRLWSSSPAMCRTLQSMAAATLVDDFPQFGPVGLKMRNEAISMLEKQPVMDDKSLLAMLMLGQTASWHNPNDLGVSFFNLLRNHINSLSSDSNSSSMLTNRNNYQFFEEALVYWEMLLSYVADHNTLASSVKSGIQTPTDSILSQRVPHPWTGIARDTQFTVHEVGRLIRRERSRVRSRQFTSQGDIIQAQKAIEKSQELEQRLLNLAHPTETEIVNPGDDDTPVWHLLAMAEVYRYTGLIQLYRVFPDLLRTRLQLENISEQTLTYMGPSSFNAQNPSSASLLSNAGLPDGVFDGSAFQFDEETGDIPEPVRNEWLTTFAVTAMSRLKTIPLESRTRCLQPFLLVASSSELRLPPTDVPSSTLDSNAGVDDYALNLSPHAIEVSRTRKFILGRLSSFLHVLPPKPIHICLKLVKEVWSRMDAGESNVYWMDVMIDNGWETTMG
jgi:hypothetical protein